MTVLSQGNDQYFRFVTRLSRAMEVKAAGGTLDPLLLSRRWIT